ncbi:hypothetical protein CH63R_12201 [Colletotrichum higginsianum IMI 349063]|uniref:Uncharacterized protein n=1 Tax=Colletotrichum higginsianum (strain IMI 349063) TaxID=759273 RepID=A0A1B7Y0F2_COLHI|nr:hypothetical protein CH63R_12201 [Colletotrichum higginsianum IMI 349063]OBR05498.1 hypothetical protein CH63R_12201 [Colletotrichum higginsianum IMI 349063]
MFLGPGGSPKSPKAKACPRQILSRPKGHVHMLTFLGWAAAAAAAAAASQPPPTPPPPPQDTFTPPSFFQGVQLARETFTDPGGAVRRRGSSEAAWPVQ